VRHQRRDRRARAEAPRFEQRKQGGDGARLLQQAECERRRGLHGRGRVPECGDERVQRLRIADPPRGERRLAPHERVGMMQRLTEQRRVVHARLRGGEEAGQPVHHTLVPLRRGGAAQR